MFKKIKSKKFYIVALVISLLLSILMFWFFRNKDDKVYLAFGIFFVFASIAYLNEIFKFNLNLRLFRNFYTIKFFLKNALNYPYESWILFSIISFFILLFEDLAFWVSFALSPLVGGILYIVSIPIIFVLLIVFVIVEFVWREFLDKKEYESIVFFFQELEDKKHCEEMSYLKNDSKDNKKSSNYIWGLLTGLGLGWFIFKDEDK